MKVSAPPRTHRFTALTLVNGSEIGTIPRAWSASSKFRPPLNLHSSVSSVHSATCTSLLPIPTVWPVRQLLVPGVLLAYRAGSNPMRLERRGSKPLSRARAGLCDVNDRSNYRLRPTSCMCQVRISARGSIASARSARWPRGGSPEPISPLTESLPADIYGKMFGGLIARGNLAEQTIGRALVWIEYMSVGNATRHLNRLVAPDSLA